MVQTSSLVLSAIILWNPIPTPSITANKHAHPIAEFRAAFAPPRIAKDPPVKNPAMTSCMLTLTLIVNYPFHQIWHGGKFRNGHILALYGSSFFLMPLTAQSNVENNPPQTPKFPPSTGALALIAVRAPILRSPYGLLRNPFTPCHTDPPIAYKKKLLACFRYCGSKCGKVNCYKQSGFINKTLETIS